MAARPILAQQPIPGPTPQVVDSILLEGNHRTKRNFILHEIDIHPGDTLQAGELSERLERNRLRIMNLGLFTDASLQLVSKTESGHAVLVITVAELWFTYPVPLFELADRNFNVWWTEFHRSLKRVNYGINWSQLNLSGKGDILRLNANFGYNNRYEITYSSPAINSRQTLGMQAGVSFNRAHEVALNTFDNKLTFRRDPNFWQIERWQANAGLSWRPHFYSTHGLVLEYHLNSVPDTIAHSLNPDFFLNGRNTQRHFSLVYSFYSDHRDIRPYPLNGWLSQIELRVNGLLPSDDLHLVRLRAEMRKYHAFSPRWSVGAIAVGRVSLPHGKPPYFNDQALGYGSEYVSGYEYFVADGLDYALFKTAAHFEILDKSFNLGRWMPLSSYKQFPIRIYLSANNDLGYARDDYYAANNPLSNRVMWGYGLGIDFVAYYGMLAQLEWSFNDLGQQGFYVHIDTGL